MMSILIKGMEMPKGESCVTVRIWGDGRVIGVHNDSLVKHAIKLPAHGRLIDADVFESIKYELPDGQKAFNRGFHSGVQYVQRLIMDAPTILEAEEGE